MSVDTVQIVKDRRRADHRVSIARTKRDPYSGNVGSWRSMGGLNSRLGIEMALLEQAARRVEFAHRIGAKALRWVASAASAAGLAAPLCGFPIVISMPRLEEGLEVVLTPS